MPNEFKRIQMVGRLAKDEEIGYGRKAVFINKYNSIQYIIKSLSTKNDIAEDQFTGYTNTIRNFENSKFVDDEYSDPEERERAFTDYYSKRLFIFSHVIDSYGNIKNRYEDVWSLMLWNDWRLMKEQNLFWIDF